MTTKAPEIPTKVWPPLQRQWTYKDYCRLPDNGMRYEVIEGNLYMTPAPRPKHQRVIARLHGYFWDYLKQHPVGEVFLSPIDVIIHKLATPVQPDLLFISHEKLTIVKDKYIEGIPDLVVEFISSDNPGYDRRTKFDIYARAGVREYWIIDPYDRFIEIYVLRGQAYALLGKFEDNDAIHSEVIPDFSFVVKDVCLS